MSQQMISDFTNKPSMEHIIINDEIMPSYVFGPYNTLIIKAVMGIGKTNTLYEYINKHKNKSILIVSFRVSLEEKYIEDLDDFMIYNKIKGNIDVINYDKLIMQIDSLHRIRGNYDLIIFDEFIYTVSHLVTSCKTREKSYDCMKQLIKGNQKMIFMDAFIDKEIVDWISLFPNRTIKYIENKYTIHDKKKIISYKYDINNFIKELKNSLKNKEKIVIASNNKTELQNIENILNKNFQNIRKLFINKDTKNKYNINEWKNIDVLGYTPTITAGISFTEKRFDKIFGLFCNNTSPADMSIQQLFRVRNISTNEYHICCKITGKKDYPLDDNGIEKYIMDNEKCLVDGVKGIRLDYIKNEIKKDKYFYLYKYIQKKIFKSNNDYMGYMLELLKEQGIKDVTYNCTFNKEETKIYNKEYREYRKEKEDIECDLVVKSPLIDDEEEKELENNYNRTYEQNNILKKHKFLKLSKISHDILTKDNYKKYNKYITQLYHLAYMYAYKDDVYNNFNKRLNIYIKNSINDDTITRLHRDKKLEKRIYVNDIVISLGFKNIFDKEEIYLNKDNVIKYILENQNNLNMLFKTNKHNWEDIIKTDDKYFTKVMRYLNDRMNSIFKIRIVLNKKNKKYYIKGLDFWDDNSITYKNPVLIEHVKQKEEDFYMNSKTDDLLNQYLFDNNLIDNNGIPKNNHSDYIEPKEYLDLYKNKTTILQTYCLQDDCDVPISPDDEYCINHKPDIVDNNINTNHLCIDCKQEEPCRWLLEDGLQICESCNIIRMLDNN